MKYRCHYSMCGVLHRSTFLGKKAPPWAALDFHRQPLCSQASIVWTKTKACLTCLVSWLFAFGLTAPIISITTFTPGPPVPACLTSVDNWWSKFYFVVIITVFFFIPLLILVVLYVYIASRYIQS